MKLMNGAFPFKMDQLNTWEESSLLLPHVLAAASHSECLGVALQDTGWLFNQAALYQKYFGNFHEAKVNFEHSLEIYTTTLGSDHAYVATIIINLCNVLRELGDFQGAKKNYQKALEIDMKVSGPDHPEVAIDLNNIGAVLQDLGDFQGAKKNYQKALEIDMKVFGPDHPKVAIRLNNLGSILEDLGDLKEAKKNYEQLWRFSENSWARTIPIRLQ